MAWIWEQVGNGDWVKVNTLTSKVHQTYSDAEYKERILNKKKDVVETVTDVATNYNPTDPNANNINDLVEALKPDVDMSEVKTTINDGFNGIVDIFKEFLPTKTETVQTGESATTGKPIMSAVENVDIELVGTVVTGVGILWLLKKLWE